MQGYQKNDSIDLGLDEYPYGESFLSALDDTISPKSIDNNDSDVIKFPSRY